MDLEATWNWRADGIARQYKTTEISVLTRSQGKHKIHPDATSLAADTNSFHTWVPGKIEKQ